ncbi:hypothetical protein [Priestia flexa]|uniref:Uncharacterized protein n=1 Tax=Priestia flexa TaxID=86664 RepID=A0A8I1SPF1_9BACI|nr:hypothetical protein [Priestia flexa]MBN8252723.1 hypothetical protein [Priestia flexa]UZW66733.1 hypothetical protein OC195_01975 [Priestia flexa]
MEHMGWISLIPAVIAVVLALISKNVILSLFMGALSGIVILQKRCTDWICSNIHW